MREHGRPSLQRRALATATTFFAGSLSFTSAGYIQWYLSINGERAEDRLIWAPDLFGSIAFLISSAIAFSLARHLSPSAAGRRAAWWEGALNLAGSVAFGLSAIAAVVLPTTGEPLNLAIVNAGTFIGALCFLAGAILVLKASNLPLNRIACKTSSSRGSVFRRG